jgi:hypothetical protein
MKLRTSTAAIALLACSVALGGCGEEQPESATTAQGGSPLGYGNYAARGAASVEVPIGTPARAAAQPYHSRAHSVDGSHNFPGSELAQAPRSSSQDPDKVSRFE